jgi:hypothetical protein
VCSNNFMVILSKGVSSLKYGCPKSSLCELTETSLPFISRRAYLKQNSFRQ